MTKPSEPRSRRQFFTFGNYDGGGVMHGGLLLRAVYVMDSLHNPTQRTDIRSLNAQKGMIKFTNKCI